jgi:cell division protein FtsB
VDDVKLYYHEEIRKQKLLTAWCKKELDKQIKFAPTLDEIEYFNNEVSKLTVENKKLLEENTSLKQNNKKLKSKVNYNAKKSK